MVAEQGDWIEPLPDDDARVGTRLAVPAAVQRAPVREAKSTSIGVIAPYDTGSPTVAPGMTAPSVPCTAGREPGHLGADVGDPLAGAVDEGGLHLRGVGARRDLAAAGTDAAGDVVEVVAQVVGVGVVVGPGRVVHNAEDERGGGAPPRRRATRRCEERIVEVSPRPCRASCS